MSGCAPKGQVSDGAFAFDFDDDYRFRAVRVFDQLKCGRKIMGFTHGNDGERAVGSKSVPFLSRRSCTSYRDARPTARLSSLAA